MGRNEEALCRLRQRQETGSGRGLLAILMHSLQAYLENDASLCVRPLHELETLPRRDPESLFYMARHLGRIGEREQAIAILGKVIDGGFLCASSLVRDPWLDPLRGAPGFRELSQRVEDRRQVAHAAFLRAGG